MTRPLFFVAVFAVLSAFAAGGFYNSFLFTVILCALCALSYTIFGSGKHHAVFWAALGIALGFLINCFYSEGIYRPLFGFDGKRVEICAKIESVKQAEGAYGTVYVYQARLISLEDDEKGFVRPVHFTVYADDDLHVMHADLVRFISVLSLREPASGDPVYDEVLMQRGYGTAFSIKAEKQLVEVTGRGIANPLIVFSGWLKQRMENVSLILPEAYRPLFFGLLTGDKNGLDDYLKDRFSKSGIAHILAASGMHLAILTGLLAALLGAAGLGSAVSGLLLSVFVLFYMAVAGFSPSIIRAGLMCWFSYLAFAVKRDYDGFSALGASALLLLAINPYCVFNISFLLSFSATAGILYVPIFKEKFLPDFKCGKLFRKPASIILASCMASLFTAPFVLLYFNRLSVLTPIANLLILPMLPALFVFCLLLLFCFKIAWAGLILSKIVTLLFSWILLVIDSICKVPFSSFDIYNPYRIAFALYLFFALLFFLLLSKKEKRKSDLCLLSLLVLISFGAVSALPLLNRVHEGAKVTFIDVGNGAATVIQTADKTVLIDCGTSYTQSRAYLGTIRQMALSGVNSIDYLILTHYHSDHTNGVEGILDRISVKNVILRPFDEDDIKNFAVLQEILDSRANVIQTGEKMEISLSPDTDITVFPPLSGLDSADENENGLAVLLCSEGHYGLFTGDFNKKHEIVLMRDYPIRCDLLMVSHHGSKNSSWAGFIDRLSPDLSVISCARESGYGFPHEETLNTLEQAGCRIARTDREGNIVVCFKSDGLYQKS